MNAFGCAATRTVNATYKRNRNHVQALSNRTQQQAFNGLLRLPR